jgi:nucleotide-binding universal stress UspA family protein
MYQRILVPYDGSAASTLGLDEAIKIAKLTGASLLILHVLNESAFVSGFDAVPIYAGEAIAVAKKSAEELLAGGCARAAASGVTADSRLLENFVSRLSELVVEQIQDWKADLVVIGSHGRRGFQRLLLGSDAEQILRAATVPVLLVRAPAAPAAAQPG